MNALILTDRHCKRCDKPIPASAHFNATICPSCKPQAEAERIARYRANSEKNWNRGNRLDREGAEDLAREIKRYWAERGYSVETKVVRAGFDNAARGCRYDVRSNLLNGQPR